jgi:hypothetical protein
VPVKFDLTQISPEIRKGCKKNQKITAGIIIGGKTTLSSQVFRRAIDG